MIDKITDITKRLGSAFLTTSRELFARQYAISDEETIEQGFWRSTVPIEHNHDERLLLFEKIMEKKFCPGGRILAGAGTSHRNTLNCFVLAPNSRRFDYLDDVEDLVLKVAATTKVGGGIGINFDPFASVQYATPVDIEIWHTMDPGHPDYSDFVGWQYTDITAYGQPKRRYDRRGALIVDYSEREAMSAPIIVVEDSISAIFRAPFDAVRTGAKRVILDWSNLRPEGAAIKGSGGTSSGAASFAIEVQHIIHWLSLGGQTAGPVNALRYVFQPVLRSVRQGGTRRGAGMATLSINHPDAEIFLSCKDHDVEDSLGEISAFNISFLARDEDMDNPFLEKVAKHAWLTGDPGLLFVDTINRDNPLAAIDGYILSTNPCLTGDAMILTADGPRSFKELADDGNDVLVWCVDKETNEPKLSKMVRPHKTRTNAEVLRITFDSGLVVRATPDHSFFTTHRNKVKARDLKPGQSVSAFAMHQHRDGQLRILRNQKDSNTVGQWYVHRIFAEHYGMDIDGKVVHHLDKNPLNNARENLQIVTPSEHNSIHYPDRLANGFHNPKAAYVANHKVVSVEPGGNQDVYNGMVEGYHTYIVVDPSPVGKSYISGILSANCGEIPLYPGEPCDLGAINLLKYVAKNSVFNASEFANDVGLYVRYLDGNLDYAILPTEQSRIMSQRNRRIGLGVMGLAHALIKLGLRYDSQKGREATWKIFRTMAVEADQESVNMSDGKQRMSIPFERHNIALLTVAPTGTTSMIMDVSSGIEPIFSVTYRRKIGSEDRIFLDPLLMEMLREHDPDPDYVLHEGKYVDWDEAKVVEAVQKNGGSLRGLDFIPKYMQDLFQTSHEIHYRDHIAMQAAAQDGMNYRHVGNSISKTINMPHSATVDDVLDAYRYAHSMGCKGITIYRDGSRMHQVLNTDTEISLECPTGVCEL